MKNQIYKINNDLLKQYIERAGIKQKKIAETLNITTASLCAKLAGRQPWQAAELYCVSVIVGLKPAEYQMLFIANK